MAPWPPASGGGAEGQRLRVPREVLDAISGAIAGGVARLIVSPLDVLKIRFQVQLEPIHRAGSAQLSRSLQGSKYTGLLQATKEIVREEGVLGLWRGTVPGLLLVMPYSAIQFVTIHRCKSWLAGSSKDEEHEKLRPELSFGVGAVAGVAATVGSYPFDLLRTVMASQGEPKMYKNMMAACKGIVRQQGVWGLFSGISPTMAEIIPYAGMQYGFYDVFKSALLDMKRYLARLESRRQAADLSREPVYGDPQAALDPFSKFMCGLAAGSAAKAICHPLDVVKKRFQVAGLVRHPRYGANVELHSYNGMVDALRKIAATEGMAGLYKGLLPSLIKAAPAAAITFFVYELVSQRLAVLLAEPPEK